MLEVGNSDLKQGLAEARAAKKNSCPGRPRLTLRFWLRLRLLPLARAWLRLWLTLYLWLRLWLRLRPRLRLWLWLRIRLWLTLRP